MASFPASQGPLPPDVEIGTSLMIYIWVFAGISGIVLGLRLFAVFHILRRIRLADYVMVLAFILIVIAAGLIHVCYHWGFGRHARYLSPHQASQVVKYNLFAAGFQLVSAMLGRISFCLFLLNTIATKKFIQMLIYMAILAQVLFHVPILAVMYGGCGTHVAANWDHTVKAKCTPLKVTGGLFYFTSSWNAFTDFFLTVVPALLLKDLNLCLKKKIVAMVLLCLSGLAFVAAIIKTAMIKEMTSPDFSLSIAKLNFWVFGEVYVVIIVASAPLMNSLVKWGKETVHTFTSRGYGKTALGHGVSIRKTWAVELVSSYDKSNGRFSKVESQVCAV